MHPSILLSFVAAFVVGASAGFAGDVPAGMRALRFEPNRGQADAAFDFVARLPGGGVGLRGDRAVLGRAERSVALVFEGAEPGIAGVGEQPARARLHYLRGNDPSRWQRNVPTFERVRYAGVWRGVDVVWHERDGDLEYDFELAPGARVDDVVLRAEGATEASVSELGELVLETSHGPLVQSAPVCTEILPDGSVVTLTARWRLLDAAPGSSSPRLAFDVPDHDPGRPLVIDPVVTTCVLLGGPSGSEVIRGALVDAAGNLFVCGETNSNDFPVAGGGSDTTRTGDTDLFVSVFDENGTTLIASAFFGGSTAEYPTRIAEGANGHYLVCGATTSADLPTATAPGSPPPFQTERLGSIDAFVAEFDADLDLVASTYFGGTHNDGADDVVATPAGGCVIAGYTWSPDLPVPNAEQPLHGGSTDGFIAMLDDGLSTLTWSTFHGSTGLDSFRALAVDADGSFLAGGSGPDSSAINGALVARYDVNGALLDSTAFGGGFGFIKGIAVAADGAVAVAGVATDAAFLAGNPFGGISDGFVAVLSADLDVIEFSAFLGGSQSDDGADVATQGDDVWVSGTTYSSDAPFLARIAPPPVPTGTSTASRGFVAHVDRTSGPAVLDFFSCVPIGDSNSAYAIAADTPGGPVWVFGGATCSTPLNALDVLPPTVLFGSDSDSQAFALRLDPAPLGGVELIGFGLTVVDLNANYQTVHSARVYRRNDASGYAMLTWELTDASNGALLRSGAISFGYGEQLVEFPIQIAGLPPICTLTLELSDSPGLLDGRASSQQLDPAATSQQLLITQPPSNTPIVFPSNDDDDECCIARVMLERNGNDISPLRRFRDRVLSRFELGRRFTRWYYEQSPDWVAFLRRHPVLVPCVRLALRILVAIVAHPLLFIALLVAARWSPRLCVALLRRRRRRLEAIA